MADSARIAADGCGGPRGEAVPLKESSTAGASVRADVVESAAEDA